MPDLKSWFRSNWLYPANQGSLSRHFHLNHLVFSFSSSSFSSSSSVMLFFFRAIYVFFSSSFFTSPCLPFPKKISITWQNKSTAIVRTEKRRKLADDRNKAKRSLEQSEGKHRLNPWNIGSWRVSMRASAFCSIVRVFDSPPKGIPQFFLNADTANEGQTILRP